MAKLSYEMCDSGKKIRRKSWASGMRLDCPDRSKKEFFLYDAEGELVTKYFFSAEDRMADDWEMLE